VTNDETGTLEELLERAAANARTHKHRVLVSVTERVDVADPLLALNAAVRIASADTDLAELIATRMYWTRPIDGFTLAGLGAAVTFAPDGADRFATIDREWSALIGDALTVDTSGCAPGAGPTLMGGFAFDPEGPRTELWRDFPAAHLMVPRLLLARMGDECSLTTTIIVRADGQPDIQPELIVRLRSALLANVVMLTGSNEGVASGDHVTYADVRNASDWRVTVRDAVDDIRTGKIEKVVLAREVRAAAQHDFDIITALHQMRSAHPTCYVFGFWHGDSAFVGATPERLVRVDDRNVQASSLAGSARRGTTPEDDSARAAELLASEKDRVEHEIVRRALVAGLERLCDDVITDDGPALLSLPNVYHLHTAVRAQLRSGHTLLQVVAQLHPTPAVGGAPRNAALRFIREHEKMDRGWYAAPIGWLQRDRGEFAVALRSSLITGSRASLFAGCGVVADSDPDQEYAESLLKLRPMEMSLAAALVIDDSRSDDESAAIDDPAAIDSTPALCSGDAG
jgi:isochorismate synthase